MSAVRIVASASFLVLLVGCRSDPAPRSASADTLAYVGRDVCAQCHQEEAFAWTGSDHDLAMSEPTAETVLGDFSDARFSECGVETRFFTEDGGFFIRTLGEDGEMTTYPVRYTFGHDPLQQYLVPTSRGRLQAFMIAWDAAGERWFSLYPDECIEPEDPLHWTGDAMNWNYMCADCHSTNLQRNFSLSTSVYETSYSEIDVSCEACHGPGERHVEIARSGEYPSDSGDGEMPRSGDAPSRALEAATPERVASATGLTVHLSTGPTSRDALRLRRSDHAQVESCAPCHSRRRTIHPNHISGKPFLDHYEPELLREDLYFPDGQIKDEVYVYGSFVQSKMYAENVACSDCHDPHSTKLKLEGNALCGQCHEPAQYDSYEHIRHLAGTEGSQCVDCHMPERTYMVIDPRRDHSFPIPRPDLTAELGTPNACSSCHGDRPPQWAAAQIESWHGEDRPPHTARAIAGGRAVQPDAEEGLIRIAADTAIAGITRATALSLLDEYPTVRATNAAEDALEDPDPLTRVAAVRALNPEEDRSVAPLLEPLLRDPVRLVRTEAARVLTPLAASRYARRAESDVAEAYWSALEEYRAGQLAVSDQAASHLNLALVHEGLGEVEEAEEAYRTALRVDSSFVPAHMNIAMLYNRRRTEALEAGRSEEARALFEQAETALSRAARLSPDAAEVRYTLGLLLAEDPERLEEAADHLGRAAQLDSSNARIQYNAGLAQQRLGRAGAAERLLSRAHRLAPENPDYINALGILYAQQERWGEALRFTDMLLQQYPNNRDLAQRRAYIERQM